MLVHNGCTPVGCVLIQILKLWGSHITTTCYKRAVPVAKALGASDVIVIPENQTAKTKTDLEVEVTETKTLSKLLELHESFDVIFNTKDCEYNIVNLEDYCTKDGIVVSTQLPHLSSDSYGFIRRSVFSFYVTTKCFFQVSIIKYMRNSYTFFQLTLDDLF